MSFHLLDKKYLTACWRQMEFIMAPYRFEINDEEIPVLRGDGFAFRMYPFQFYTEDSEMQMMEFFIELKSTDIPDENLKDEEHATFDCKIVTGMSRLCFDVFLEFLQANGNLNPDIYSNPVDPDDELEDDYYADWYYNLDFDLKIKVFDPDDSEYIANHIPDRYDLNLRLAVRAWGNIFMSIESSVSNVELLAYQKGYRSRRFSLRFAS